MIVVEVCSKHGQIHAFTVSGHADLDEYGKDIFCAAVSAIAQTALLGLLQQISPPASYSKSSGYLKVALAKEIDQTNLDNSQIILRTMLGGLNFLADDKPESLKIVTRRC